MPEFNIGDRFYALWEKDVFTLHTISNSYTKKTYRIRWRKYDADRDEDYCDHDGIISEDSLSKGQLGPKYEFFKIRDDKHLLELRLKYA
jgi:hypothetical protein